jgi:hypothetical protein
VLCQGFRRLLGYSVRSLIRPHGRARSWRTWHRGRQVCSGFVGRWASKVRCGYAGPLLRRAVGGDLKVVAALGPHGAYAGRDPPLLEARGTGGAEGGHETARRAKQHRLPHPIGLVRGSSVCGPGGCGGAGFRQESAACARRGPHGQSCLMYIEGAHCILRALLNFKKKAAKLRRG